MGGRFDQSQPLLISLFTAGRSLIDSRSSGRLRGGYSGCEASDSEVVGRTSKGPEILSKRGA